MQRPTNQNGVTLLELLAVVVVFATMILVTAPPLIEIVRNSRLRSAARHMAGDVQLARSRAVGTGWQFRVTGMSAGAADVRRNQYRIMSRESPAVTWPALNVAPTDSATLVVTDWVDMDEIYPGVAINSSDSGQFALTFDTRGNPTEMTLNFNPLQITGTEGEKWVTVSAVGAVHVE